MKVLVVDDNQVMRAGLKAMLRSIGDVDDVIEAKDGRQALTVLASAHPPVDLVFLDVRMPGMDGLTVLKQINGTPVVMLTGADDRATVQQAMAAGARGYLVNGEFTEAELAATLHLCRHGGVVLSPTAAARTYEPAGPPANDFGFTSRERDLVEALAEGLSNQQIAERLFLSEKTVKNHLNRIYGKMGVSTRSEAIVAWLRN